VSLDRRLARLEQRPTNDGDLRAHVEALAREHDLPFEEVYELSKRLLGMTKAERLAFGAEVRAEVAARGESTDELDAIIRQWREE